MGVSARMYNYSNSLGDRAKEGRGSEHRHAGTGEGISARRHVENSHGDRAEEGRRSDCRHCANSLWERDESCMSVGASIASQSRSEGFNRSWKSIVIKKKLRHERTASVGVTPLNCTLGHYPNGILPRVNEAASKKHWEEVAAAKDKARGEYKELVGTTSDMYGYP